jgi:hypothetical protein
VPLRDFIAVEQAGHVDADLMLRFDLPPHDRDLDRVWPGLLSGPPPDVRRTAVAENGAVAARQHGRHLARMWRLGAVADQIDAGMERMESPVPEP